MNREQIADEVVHLTNTFATKPMTDDQVRLVHAFLGSKRFSSDPASHKTTSSRCDECRDVVPYHFRMCSHHDRSNP